MRIRNYIGNAYVFSALLVVSASAQADVIISKLATTHITCSSGICTQYAQKSRLNVTQLETMLASGNVTVVTTSSPSTGNIDVNTEITWASTNTLTLTAYDSILIENTVAVNGSGNLNVNFGTGPYGGSLNFAPKTAIHFLSTSSNLSINGAPFTLVSDIATLADDIAGNPQGNYALADNYTATADGTYATSPVATTFTGMFEGLGNTIAHLRVADSHDEYVGLFAQIGPGGSVSNLNIANARITGGSQSPLFAGIYAGMNSGGIVNCAASGTLLTSSNASDVGGFVGENLNYIDNSYAAVAVSAGKSSRVGGLVGLSIGSGIIDSYSVGSVTALGGGQSYVGGLVGDAYETSDIFNSYASGAVSGSPRDAVGGLVGFSEDSRIASSYAAGPVSGGTSHFNYGFSGGLVGYDDGSNSYSSVYWDTTTSGIGDPSRGIGNYPNFPGIMGLTTAQFQSGLPSGLNAPAWGESASINGGLPYLLGVPPR